jgi:hypothetical protein
LIALSVFILKFEDLFEPTHACRPRLRCYCPAEKLDADKAI